MTEIVIAQPAPLADRPTISADLLAGQLAASSIEMYRRDFAAYMTFAGGEGTHPAALARWRAHLAQQTDLSPNTINRMLSAVKRLMKEAASQGYISHELAEQFKRVDGVKVKALRERQKRHARTRIAPEDMRRICEAPDASTPLGLRDRALLATLASSGCRVSEVATLTTGQIEKRANGYVMLIIGKGQSEPREAPLSREAYNLIQQWIARRAVLSQYIFTSFAGRSGKQNERPMTEVAAWLIVQKYAELCDLEHIKPHDFRRFVGTQLAKSDIRKAQKALGHKRIDTTAQHYVLDELETGLTDNLY